MGLEATREKVAALRVGFEASPRDGALALAQQLGWYAMELGLDRQYLEAGDAWAEAVEVAAHVLTEGGPSQYERTEFIRLGVGAARALMMAGGPDGVEPILAGVEEQFELLAAEAAQPQIVLALRGPILGARAELHRLRNDRESEIDALCESVLQMLAGSEASPQLIGSMLNEPLRHLSAMLKEEDAA